MNTTRVELGEGKDSRRRIENHCEISLDQKYLVH